MQKILEFSIEKLNFFQLKQDNKKGKNYGIFDKLKIIILINAKFNRSTFII